MDERKLLILDDDPMTGSTIGFIAESDGVESRATTSPTEFFEMLESWQPSHVALDLVMPEMDGVEVLVEMARRESPARIIITSGVGSRVLDAAGRSATEHGLNIAGVLSKPFSPGELRGLLHREHGIPLPVEPESGPAPAAGQVDDQPARQELEAALDARGLDVCYQPKILCATGQMAGFEALVRWTSPTRGAMSPAEFIPLAESSGLISRLTEQVLEQAMGWFGQHFGETDRGADPDNLITLSVNISARSLVDGAFVEQTQKRCHELGIQPQQLIFELTESSTMEDPVASLDLLTRLRMKGFQLSIDDFGTGYSSMLQLVRLPFSEIKVDKSFVMSALQSEESRAVVRSVVELGHSLGLRTTAEGVEDAGMLEYLRSIHCSQAQGFHISPPVPGPRAWEWAQSNLADKGRLEV